jgi:hypothetical protein
MWKIPAPEQDIPEQAEKAPEQRRGPTDVRFGYTLNDLDRLARTVVVANSQWWPAGDRKDQADTAWSGIVEYLYTTEDEPAERDLLDAGTRALVEDTKGYRKHHGLRNGGLIADGPRFATYWYEPPAEPWEERVIERIAVNQILAQVKPHEVDALLALAAHGDYAAAAEGLGLNYTTLTVRLSNARKTFRRHWFTPDTAPPIKGTDRRVGSRATPLRTHCSSGHEFTPENTQWRAPRVPGRARTRVCRACESDRSKARTAARNGRAAASEKP